MISPINYKQCSKCKENKSTSDFTPSSQTKDGYQEWCKSCKNIAAKQYRLLHLKERREYDIKNYHNNRDKIRKRKSGYFQKRRLHTLQIVSGLEVPKCIICGCDFIPMLEINHINEDGKKDRQLFGKSEIFYNNIIKGTRKIDDLDVRCRFHNDLHYYENKFSIHLPFKIIWGNN